MNTDLSKMTTKEIIEAQEFQRKLEKEERAVHIKRVKFITSYKINPALENNAGLSRSEKKLIIKSLEKEEVDLTKILIKNIKGDDDKSQKERDELQSYIDNIKISDVPFATLSNDQREMVFDVLVKSREINEPSDLELADLYIFVELVLGRTYEKELFEGN